MNGSGQNAAQFTLAEPTGWQLGLELGERTTSLPGPSAPPPFLFYCRSLLTCVRRLGATPWRRTPGTGTVGSICRSGSGLLRGTQMWPAQSFTSPAPFWELSYTLMVLYLFLCFLSGELLWFPLTLLYSLQLWASPCLADSFLQPFLKRNSPARGLVGH